MNFLELRYFVAVAEILNISKAAELLFISQQALSKHIRNLEQSLGTPLFKRSPRLTLTYMGERFLKTAHKLHQIADNGETEPRSRLIAGLVGALLFKGQIQAGEKLPAHADAVVLDNKG